MSSQTSLCHPQQLVNKHCLNQKAIPSWLKLPWITHNDFSQNGLSQNGCGLIDQCRPTAEDFHDALRLDYRQIDFFPPDVADQLQLLRFIVSCVHRILCHLNSMHTSIDPSSPVAEILQLPL